MKGLLVRVGCDSTDKYGHWNAPVDPKSGEFVYVPKPELPGWILPDFRADYSYTKAVPHLERFAERFGTTLDGLGFPPKLREETMHLDPDFEHLTYGDKPPRNSKISALGKDDIIVFYSGLKPISPCQDKTVYALIGLYILKDKPRLVNEVSPDIWKQNAHTRRRPPQGTRLRYDWKSELVVWADPNLSGRLKKCIRIGKYRNKAYRVTEDLLQEWGGITSKDGYIQRSGVLPEFNEPRKFYSWFERQNPRLEKRNF